MVWSCLVLVWFFLVAQLFSILFWGEFFSGTKTTEFSKIFFHGGNDLLFWRVDLVLAQGLHCVGVKVCV